MAVFQKQHVSIYVTAFLLSGFVHSLAWVFLTNGQAMCMDHCQSAGWPALTYNEVDNSNPLWTYFQSYTDGPIIHKWLPYFSVYHRFFSRFRGKPVRFLEIGVQSGGTIKFWQHYFGHHLDYHGVDINFLCKEMFGGMERVSISTGDQANASFWAEFLVGKAPFDIIIDDGGHSMEQQITTFEALYPHMAMGGVYLVEDVATSYDRASPTEKGERTTMWGGGYGKSTTWSEYAKNQVDHVQGHYINRDGFPSDVTRTTLGVSFFDQMVVFEVNEHPAAEVKKHGTFQLPFLGGSRNIDKDELARLKKAVEPFV